MGGLNAKGIAEQQAARERAEQLRPIFAELVDMSARKAAEELNRRAWQHLPAGNGMRPLCFEFANGLRDVDLDRVPATIAKELFG